MKEQDLEVLVVTKALRRTGKIDVWILWKIPFSSFFLLSWEIKTKTTCHWKDNRNDQLGDTPLILPAAVKLLHIPAQVLMVCCVFCLRNCTAEVGEHKKKTVNRN